MTEQPATRARGTRTDADRLAWAVRFAYADLAAWRDGDFLNALDDAEDLAFRGDSATALASLYLRPAKGGPPDLEEVKAWLTPLQEAMREFVEKIAQERQKALSAPPRDRREGVFLPIQVPFSGQAVFTMPPPYRRLQVTYAPKDPAARTVFIAGMVLRVGDLLTRVDLARLKRCPECKRLFLAIRRQRFDSRECSVRYHVRRFREKARPAHGRSAKRRR